MMGIERKSLSMSEKDRLATAIHESGHAITCYFNKHANKLYKATIVARGGALGVVSPPLFFGLLIILFYLDVYDSE
jgi:cell division protease FtsH